MTPSIQLNDLLRLAHYDIGDILMHTIETHASPGEVASILMVGGHIRLAQAMVDRGAVPERIKPENLPSRRYYEDSPEAYPLGIALLMSNDIQHFDMSAGEMIQSPIESLRHMLKDLDTWPVGLNEITDQLTLLYHIPQKYRKGARNIEAIWTALLDAGADINVQSDTQNAIMGCAHSYPDMDKSYYENDNFNWKEHYLLCAHSAKANYQKILDLGFDKSRQPHLAISSAIGADAFHMGILQEGSQLGIRAQALIDFGFELASPIDCPAKVNPFYVALKNGQTSVIRALLEAGCDPAWIDPKTGDTLFALGAKGKNYTQEAFLEIPNEKISKLVNRPNNKGDTPFHQAVASLSLPLIQKLVACGADINARNKKGQLPLQAVKKNGADAKKALQSIIDFLEETGADVLAHQTPGVLHHACRSLAHETVKNLITLGADVHSSDNQGCTPLCVLAKSSKFIYSKKDKTAEARQSYEAIVDLLLDAGADINAPDKKGNTPLHHAVSVASPIMVSVLLRLGAKPDALNKKGQAPSHVWQDKWYRSEHLGALRIVELFSGSGFDPRRAGPNGELPFAHFRGTPQFISAQDEWDLRQNTQQVASAQATRNRL